MTHIARKRAVVVYNVDSEKNALLWWWWYRKHSAWCGRVIFLCVFRGGEEG